MKKTEETEEPRRVVEFSAEDPPVDEGTKIQQSLDEILCRFSQIVSMLDAPRVQNTTKTNQMIQNDVRTRVLGNAEALKYRFEELKRSIVQLDKRNRYQDDEVFRRRVEELDRENQEILQQIKKRVEEAERYRTRSERLVAEAAEALI